MLCLVAMCYVSFIALLAGSTFYHFVFLQNGCLSWSYAGEWLECVCFLLVRQVGILGGVIL